MINVEEPLFLSLNSEVHGLTVSYKVNRSENQDGSIISSQRLVIQKLYMYVLNKTYNVVIKKNLPIHIQCTLELYIHDDVHVYW